MPRQRTTLRRLLRYGLPYRPRLVWAVVGMVVYAIASAGLAYLIKPKVFTRATSLGGVESLIEHRASSEGPTSRTRQELIRLSIGLEHPDDLIADLEQALR